ncbi:MAG: alanine:cation symporter family protein [Fibrobacteres bacterium]|nr:alanine:cation symporter family protein [Fibrobacterota bacterium]
MIQEFFSWFSGILWGPPLLILLIGTHLFLTIRLKLIQRFVWKGVKLSVSKDKDSEGDVTQFGALATALAATIGTGNIVGVATAVGLGGPGAVFWMWITGVLGIATKYSEALLSVKYRVRTERGTFLGGPMYVLERGLGVKWLGILFAVFTALASFGIGNMVQANSLSALAHDTVGIPTWVSGLVMAVLTALVILGGVKSIARVCSALVPFMAIFYVAGSLVILAYNFDFLGEAVRVIMVGAFNPEALGGGFAGYMLSAAMRYGVARGLFSNESGLGSAPIVAAAAQTKNPVRQALVSATGTFWDTVVICLMTGLVLVSSMIRYPDTMVGLKGSALTQAAFSVLPVVGPWILSIGLATFVFSTILGWSYYGEKAVEYLAGAKALMPYRLLWVIAVFVGATSALPLVWDFADCMNALMALPNILSLVLLSNVIVAETKTYLWTESN